MLWPSNAANLVPGVAFMHSFIRLFYEGCGANQSKIAKYPETLSNWKHYLATSVLLCAKILPEKPTNHLGVM